MLDPRDEQSLVKLVRTNCTILSMGDFTDTDLHKYLNEQQAHRCFYRQEVRVREANLKKRLNWYRGKVSWNVNGQWDKNFSNESQVVLGATQRILIWRRKDEAESPDCVCPSIQRKVNVMILGCIT